MIEIPMKNLPPPVQVNRSTHLKCYSNADRPILQICRGGLFVNRCSLNHSNISATIVKKKSKIDWKSVVMFNFKREASRIADLKGISSRDIVEKGATIRLILLD